MKFNRWFESKKLEVTQKELEEVREELRVSLINLKEQNQLNRKLKEELEDVKLKKKIEEEDTKHLVKIKLEQGQIDLQKKVMENDKVKDDAIYRVKQEYADKMQSRLETEVKNIKEMYGQILSRIPDVNVRLKGEV